MATSITANTTLAAARKPLAAASSAHGVERRSNSAMRRRCRHHQTVICVSAHSGRSTPALRIHSSSASAGLHLAFNHRDRFAYELSGRLMNNAVENSE